MNAEIIPIKKPIKVWGPVIDGRGTRVAGLRLHIPSGIIHVRKTFIKMGIPTLSRSTGEKTLGRAKTQAQILIQAWINEHIGVDDSHAIARRKTKTWSEASDWVLENYTPTQRLGTQNLHRYYFGVLNSHWGDLDINSITDETLQNLVKKLRKTSKRHTFEDYSKAANVIMKFAYQKKWATHRMKFTNPDKAYTQKIQNKVASHQELNREEKEALELKKSRILSRDEIDALWSVMNEELKDQFVLAFECFMRLREALHLEVARFDQESGVITLRAQDVKTGSKTGRGRSFVASPHAVKRLRARLAKLGISAIYFFPSPTDPKKPINQNKTAWRSAKRLAKITGKTRWHDLRHTALHFALLGDPSLPKDQRKKARKEPLLVSEYAGVSMKTIQAVYLKNDPLATEEVSTANAVSLENSGNAVVTQKNGKDK